VVYILLAKALLAKYQQFKENGAIAIRLNHAIAKFVHDFIDAWMLHICSLIYP
jgi:hypothetical protein